MHSKAIDQGGPVAANLPELRARLEKLVSSQQRMCRVNSYLRNGNLRGLKEMGYSETGIAALLSGAKSYLGAGFFPAHKISNTEAKIRAVRSEIQVAELASGNIPMDVENDLYRYHHDALSVTFGFDAKPDKAIRAVLRRQGFIRSSGEFQYSREWSSAALRAASAVRRFLDA